MRAFTLDGFGAAPALRDDLPEPRVGENQLLVHVRASSVNPVDAFIAAGGLEEMAEHEFPVTLGRDFAGPAPRRTPRDRRAPGSEPAQLPARAGG